MCYEVARLGRQQLQIWVGGYETFWYRMFYSQAPTLRSLFRIRNTPEAPVPLVRIT